MTTKTLTALDVRGMVVDAERALELGQLATARRHMRALRMTLDAQAAEEAARAPMDMDHTGKLCGLPGETGHDGAARYCGRPLDAAGQHRGPCQFTLPVNPHRVAQEAAPRPMVAKRCALCSRPIPFGVRHVDCRRPFEGILSRGA